MKPASPLAVLLLAATLVAGVLVSLVLWPDGAGSGPGLQSEPTGNKSAIFTATPAPTPTPTPVPSGTVVEVTYFCSIYLFADRRYIPQNPLDVISGSTCRPPYPPGLISRDEDGTPLYEIQGLHLRITVRDDSGDLLDLFRPGPYPIAVGDSWPPE